MEEATLPTVGRVVHYVSYGTPGGEYTSQCRAAMVTEAGGWETLSGPTRKPTTTSRTTDRPGACSNNAGIRPECPCTS